MPVEERGLSSRRALKVAKQGDWGNPSKLLKCVRELRKVPHAEAKEGLGFAIREVNDHPGGGIGGYTQNARSKYAGATRPCAVDRLNCV